MQLDASALILWGLVAILGTFVARRGRATFLKALHSAALQLVALIPRVVLALLLAGFIAKLLPTQMIGHMMGHNSGWYGVLVAAAFGGVMPAGPMVAFPLVVVLRHADAGIPQIVSFLTAWSVFAWHRVLTYEITTMGWRFTIMRLSSSLFLPLVSASLAFVACAITGMK